MDISRMFVYEVYVSNDFAQFIKQTLPINSTNMCQMTCYFERDCHFVVRINSTTCGIGNFKISVDAIAANVVVVVSIFRGK